MARLNPEEIEALRKQADIVDVVSHYIPVQRAGKAYKAVCPFHQDHNPSLSISPDMQIYKCFVCGEGGNVFSFVKNYEKISYIDAVYQVAELTGFTLSTKQESVVRPQDPHKTALYNVIHEAISFTMYQLDTTDAVREKEYLEGRGLNSDVRKHFEIGFDPYGSKLSDFLIAKGYDRKDMVSANVTRISDRGMSDVFAGRITFPIHDRYGNPIGFSARTMDPENTSKYINTTETDVFTKGDIVYNYHRARQQARHDGKIYVCEGVTDVIAFYRAGIENAVCSLGTSLTASQVQLLKSMAAKIIFCYDGDRAGQAATFRALHMCAEVGIEAFVVRNTTGLDPDELIRSYGQDGLHNVLNKVISRMEFVLQYLSDQTNMESYLEKKEMVNKALVEINLLQDDTDREYFLGELRSLTGLSVASEVKKPSVPYVDKPVALKVPDGTKDAEEMILAMMMNSMQAIRQFEEQLGFLLGKEEQSCAMAIVDLSHRYNVIDINTLLDSTEEQGVKDLITKIAFSPRMNQAYDASQMNGAIRKIKLKVLDQQARAIRAQLNNALNQTSMKVLMEKYNDCLQQQRRLMDEENNR